MAFLPAVGGTSIGSALIRISADTSRMKAELAQMNGQVRGEMAATGQAVKGQSAAMGAAFSAVKMGIIGMGVGFAAFAVDAVKATAAFDKAMAKVYALTGQTAEQMDALRKQVLDLATVVPQGPTKLAEGLYYVISAGFSAGDALKVLKIAAMDATAGLTDTQTVADGLTSAMNAYGYSADQAAHVSDVMTAAVTAGKMEWSQLASSIGAAAVQGATAGVSLEEVTSAIATMTRSGLTAARASMGTATLMRALGNPTAGARKEMTALGITYDENTLKQKGLIGTLKMLSDAAGKHTDVIVRMKNGNIDATKSAAATAAANKGYAANLQAMTGNARGFLAAQILLSGSSKSYEEIYAASKHASDGIGLTKDAFDKFAASDPGVQFALLINKVQVAAIAFGTVLMPQIAKVLGALTDALPRAFKIIGDIWNNTLQPVLAQMFDAFGQLAIAVAGIFSGGSADKAKTGGSAIRTILQGIADVIATVIRTATMVTGALAGLFSSPIVAGLTRVLGIFILLKATVGGVLGLGASLAGSFKGLARTLTGGFLFGKGGATGSPIDQSAAALAASGKTAASELVAGASQAARILATGGGAAGLMPAGGKLVSAEEQAAMAARGYGPRLAEANMAMNAERTMAESSLMMSLKSNATGAVNTLKSGLAKVGGMLSGVIGGAADLILPVMVAAIAASFAQGPIGDWITQNRPQFARAGEKIKTDLVGGIMDLVTKSFQGADAAVGRADTMLVGNAHVSTVKLAKLGVSNATFDQLEAQFGTVDFAKGQKATLDLQKWGGAGQLGRGVDAGTGVQESIHDWWNRIKDSLDTSVRDAAQAKFFKFDVTQIGNGSYGATVDTAGLEQYLTAATTTQMNDNVKKTTEAYQAAVVASLTARGWTTGQVLGLNTDQMDRISTVAKADADGTMGFLQDFLVRSYTGGVKPKSPTIKGEAHDSRMPTDTADDQFKALSVLVDNRARAITAWSSSTDATIKAALDEFMKSPEGIGGLDPTVVASLQARFGQDWLATMKAGTDGIVVTSSADKKSAAKALGVHWQGIVAEFSRSVTAEGAAKIDAGNVAKLKAAYGDQWLTVLHGLSSGVADEATVAEMTRLFGAGWRTTLQQAGEAVWGEKGGADWDALKAKIAGGIKAQIGALTAGDFTAPKPGAKKPGAVPQSLIPVASMTPDEIKAQRAKVASIVKAAVNGGILDAASSTDTATAATGMEKLGKKLKDAIPDDAARKKFIDALVNLQKLNAEPVSFLDALGKAVPTANEVLGTIADTISDKVIPWTDAWSSALGRLVKNFPPGWLGAAGTIGNRTPATGKSAVAKAGGGFLGSNQPSWVGEGGGYRELFVPGLAGGVIPHNVSEFIAALVPNMKGAMAVAASAVGTGGGGGSHHQSISIDRMSLYNARDEADVVQRLAFLMPNGR